MRIGQNQNSQQIAFQKNLLSKGFKKVAKTVKNAVKVDPEIGKAIDTLTKHSNDLVQGKVKPRLFLDA